MLGYAKWKPQISFIGAKMKIERITGTNVAIPYASPVGPYVGRGGGSGTLGAAGLIVKVETDADVVGWGEGTGTV